MEGYDALLGALLRTDQAAAALLVIELGKVGLLVDVYGVEGAVLFADATFLAEIRVDFVHVFLSFKSGIIKRRAQCDYYLFYLL